MKRDDCALQLCFSLLQVDDLSICDARPPTNPGGNISPTRFLAYYLVSQDVFSSLGTDFTPSATHPMSDSQAHGKTAGTRYQPLHSDVELSNLYTAAEYMHDNTVHQDSGAKAHFQLRDLFDGWRFGASLGWLTCLLVLILNIVLTIWGALRGKANNGHIFEGICDQAKRYNMGLHVVINVLSTLMLGASNYSMQCLSAPTRKDIDEAHCEGAWTDIGVQSLKNLGRTQRWKWVVWVLLGSSSLPIHLL